MERLAPSHDPGGHESAVYTAHRHKLRFDLRNMHYIQIVIFIKIAELAYT
jgi:hypothetical protein